MTRRNMFIFTLVAALGFGAYGASDSFITGAMAEKSTAAKDNNKGREAVAILAGGCFWCLEQAMDKVQGVTSTTSGYIQGHVKNPTYREVSAGRSGHTEAVKVVYDPGVVSYETLLATFWRNIDPLRANAQFCDRGPQYRAGIYYLTAEQKKTAETTKIALQQSKRFSQPIVTEIEMATKFYPAEGYHQDYYLRNPVRYKYYKYACGRAKRLQQLWGAPKSPS